MTTPNPKPLTFEQADPYPLVWLAYKSGNVVRLTKHNTGRDMWVGAIRYCITAGGRVYAHDPQAKGEV